MEIHAIAEDKEHRLWVGCYGYGLLCYDLENEKFIPVSFTADFNNNINKILVDGRYLMACYDKGLVKIELP